MFYKKEPKNMSQAARLKFIREFRHIEPNDTAAYMVISRFVNGKIIQKVQMLKI